MQRHQCGHFKKWSVPCHTVWQVRKLIHYFKLNWTTLHAKSRIQVYRSNCANSAHKPRRAQKSRFSTFTYKPNWNLRVVRQFERARGWISCESSFVDCNEREIFPAVQGKIVRISGPVFISALRHKSEHYTSSVILNGVMTVTISPNKVKIRVAWQTVVVSRLESSVLVVSKVACVEIINLKHPSQKRKQVCAAQSGEKVYI